LLLSSRPAPCFRWRSVTVAQRLCRGCVYGLLPEAEQLLLSLTSEQARTRLLNYSGRRRALARHANELVAGGTKADTVVLVGDAKFSSTFGGKNGSAGPMLKAILRLREQGWTVLEVRSALATSPAALGFTFLLAHQIAGGRVSLLAVRQLCAWPVRACLCLLHSALL
jgi:hypothetical protein